MAEIGSWSLAERYPVNDEQLRKIYENDQDIYPVPFPFSRLQSWRDAHPDLSFILKTPDGQELGSVIVLPVEERYWKLLLSGEMKETELTPRELINTGHCLEDRVGLHVFHVEKAEGSEARKGFTKEVLQMADQACQWEVAGFSALTASAAGEATFAKLGFEPTGYQEVFYKDDDGSVKMRTKTAGDEASARQKDGSVVAWSKMMRKHV